MTQVGGNLESRGRQYDLARAVGSSRFRSVTVIDEISLARVPASKSLFGCVRMPPVQSTSRKVVAQHDDTVDDLGDRQPYSLGDGGSLEVKTIVVRARTGARAQHAASSAVDSPASGKKIVVFRRCLLTDLGLQHGSAVLALSVSLVGRRARRPPHRRWLSMVPRQHHLQSLGNRQQQVIGAHIGYELNSHWHALCCAVKR